MVIKTFFKKYIETILLLLILIFSGIFHFWNMLHFPYFENDEGVYFAQAWSFLSQGKLAPYTYWYDHAPLGWIFTSLWIFLTGGLFTFGFSLNSARVFMFVIHMFSTFFLFKITRKITNSYSAAVITCVFFSLSPLAIYFQRRLLLDNIMVFWILLSLLSIFYSNKRLWCFFISSIAFGIAVLSKENALFAFPVFVYIVAVEADGYNRLFAIFNWIVVSICIMFLYPLYALFKTEFFPNNSLFSLPYEHVSLLGSLKLQSARGTGLPFWNIKSDFMTNFIYWHGYDPLFITLGFASFLLLIPYAFFQKKYRIIVLLTCSLLLFFISGKLVINFYVIALIPFLSMCIGALFSSIINFYGKAHKVFAIGIACFLIVITAYYYFHNTNLHNALFTDETTTQKAAVAWIKEHVPANTSIAIDYYSNVDLGNKRYADDKQFLNADWYWKIEEDPDIREKKLHSDFHNISYIMLTAQMYRDMQGFSDSVSLLKKALANSSKVIVFSPEKTTHFDVATYPLAHPNGNWVAIFKQNSLNDYLTKSWRMYTRTYITSAGQTSDPLNATTSARIQSYSISEAAFASDKRTFDKTLQWTTKHMLLKDSNLFATTTHDSGTTTDVDEDIAFSLVYAYRRWHDPSYLVLAQKIIEGIWNHETAVVNDKRYIVAGDWTSQENKDVYTLNLSYLEPYAYRIFAQIDTTHDWNSIVATSYDVLSACSTSALDTKVSASLPPNWCNITRTGAIKAATNIDTHASDYSYDAMRVLWRVALDYQWNKEKRAVAYLQKMKIFTDEWRKNSSIKAQYHHDGTYITTDESLGQYASQLAYFSVVNKQIANEIYNQKIAVQIKNEDTQSYWGNKSDIYDQHWIWLSIALFNDKIPNLWVTTLPIQNH